MAREMVMTLFPETQAFAERNEEARAALSVRHLTKYFGHEQVLNDISFSVAEGEKPRLAWPIGERQEYDAALDRRSRSAGAWRNRAARQARRAPSRA